MKKLVALVVFAVVAVVLGMGLAHGGKRNPQVTSAPLSCYEQGARVLCFDSFEAPQGILRCTALDANTVYCGGR